MKHTLCVCFLAAVGVLTSAAQPANTIPNLYYPAYQCQNDASTGTVLNKLVKQVGGKCEVMATSDPLSLYIGVCTINCGTAGYSGITWIGPVDLVTSGAVTQDHYVQISTTGTVSDAGTSESATTVGIVENVGSAGGGAGTARIKLFSPSNTSGGTTVPHTVSATFNGNGAVATTGVICCVEVPAAGTVGGWNISVDDGSGSGTCASCTATVKFLRVATGTSTPGTSNSINTSGVSLSTGTNIRSTTLTDFTSTTVTAHDVFAVQLSAVANAHVVSVTLEYQ